MICPTPFHIFFSCKYSGKELPTFRFWFHLKGERERPVFERWFTSIGVCVGIRHCTQVPPSSLERGVRRERERHGSARKHVHLCTRRGYRQGVAYTRGQLNHLWVIDRFPLTATGGRERPLPFELLASRFLPILALQLPTKYVTPWVTPNWRVWRTTLDHEANLAGGEGEDRL